MLEANKYFFCINMEDYFMETFYRYLLFKIIYSTYINNIYLIK